MLNTRAMAKELHFNHDGSTTKKLLVIMTFLKIIDIFFRIFLF